MHCQRAVPVCLWVASADNAESIILSESGAESLMLSLRAESMDTHSAGAESIILSALPAESMKLSALFGSFNMKSAAATKKQQSAILMIDD